MNLSVIFHGLLDELDGAIGNLRKEAGANFSPVDAVIGKLRQHADTVAATIEQQGVADAKQIGGEVVTEAESDVAAAAPSVEQAVTETVGDVVQAVAAPAPIATATAVPSDGVVTAEGNIPDAPASDTPAA